MINMLKSDAINYRISVLLERAYVAGHFDAKSQEIDVNPHGKPFQLVNIEKELYFLLEELEDAIRASRYR